MTILEKVKPNFLIMTYRNGKCYDSKGNEMTNSQINLQYQASMSYISSLTTPKSNVEDDTELEPEDIRSLLSKNTNFKVHA